MTAHLSHEARLASAEQLGPKRALSRALAQPQQADEDIALRILCLSQWGPREGETDHS